MHEVPKRMQQHVGYAIQPACTFRELMVFANHHWAYWTSDLQTGIRLALTNRQEMMTL
jgi:hypothetical protein